MRARYLSYIVLTLLALAIVAQGAILPHTHTDLGFGLFNADHDLTLLATTGSSIGPLPVTAVIFLSLAAAPLAIWSPRAPTSFSPHDADSRAPPAV
jgi:hypothetical protein